MAAKMEIYLLRHGIAVNRGTPGFPNDDRPLTPEGTDKMKIGAKGIARTISDVDIILTSPLIRARETAAIAAEALGALDKIEICEYLLPESSMADTQRCLFKYRDFTKVMLVGHEPHLSSFAAYLLGAKSGMIDLKKGALCRIDIHRPPTSLSGTLVYHLQPKQLRALGSATKKLKVS